MTPIDTATLILAESTNALASVPTVTRVAQRSEPRPETAARLCNCGGALTTCAGCEHPRCLTCEPYLSDDCRWSL